MISQADIIRTLVNQNCTDESIMSTALSPDCTPPKLLEKFTEAERFDLALDVSMKLGWDVLPLWKTWAMRCLMNRNFAEARKKFRHCFQMVRSQSGRSGLLSDILNVLTRMEETKLSLSDEIKLVKQRKSLFRIESSDTDTLVPDSEQRQTVKINQLKPKIFNECMSYLQEYGSDVHKIKFYIENHLWEQAIEILVDRIVLNRFFISDVIPHSLTTGHLDDVVSSFKRQDPKFERSNKYFESLYRYFTAQKRYNTLYFVQNAIEDYAAAAQNQVSNFFLKKPVASYKEFNQRLDSLVKACHNYQKHLERLKQSSIYEEEHLSWPEFFTKCTEEETEARLRTINTQIEITPNFAINEVVGCINGIEVAVQEAKIDSNRDDSDDTSDHLPVTIFDSSQKKRIFLVALVMTYYDVNCDTCFSDSGFELSNRLINEFGLEKLQVFKTAMRIVLEDESSDYVVNVNRLLKRLHDDYLACTKKIKKKQKQQQEQQGDSSTPKSPSTPTVINESDAVISRPLDTARVKRNIPKPSHKTLEQQRRKRTTQVDVSAAYSFDPGDKNVLPGTSGAARLLCDEVLRDAIRSCREPDYQMELSKLLSTDARIELNIEFGKLSIAQRLAFDTNRKDYVVMIQEEADKLNQDYIKDACRDWLMEHQP